MKARLIILFLLIISGVNDASSQTSIEYSIPDSNIVFITKDSIKGVIFSKKFRSRHKSYAGETISFDMLPLIANSNNAITYEPLLSDILAIDERMRKFVGDSMKVISKYWLDYTKQYYGYVLPNRDSILFINCFKTENENVNNDWQNNFVSCLGGWINYFSVRYDLNRKRFFDLRINDWR